LPNDAAARTRLAECFDALTSHVRSPKRPPRVAQAQNDLIRTAADVTELDLVAAPN